MDKKPLLEHQKQRLELAIDEISTPIFSTRNPKALTSSNLRASQIDNSATNLPVADFKKKIISSGKKTTRGFYSV